MNSGFAQRHNACVAAALQDAGVKVRLRAGWASRGYLGEVGGRLLGLKGVANWGEGVVVGESAGFKVCLWAGWA